MDFQAEPCVSPVLYSPDYAAHVGTEDGNLGALDQLARTLQQKSGNGKLKHVEGTENYSLVLTLVKLCGLHSALRRWSYTNVPVQSECDGKKKFGSLTLCEATTRSTKLRKMQSYKRVFYQKKRSTFACYNLTLSESFCLTDHEKQIQKFVAHWIVCQKSSQREVIKKNAYIAPKSERVYLPALHLKFSRSLTNFQASQARQSSLRSKDRYPNHTVV